MTGGPQFISEKLDDAIRWHTRLTSGDEDECEWQEFTLWLAASPENRKAYEYVDEISSSIDRVLSAGAAAEQRLRTSVYSNPSPALRSSTLWFGSAVAVVAALLLFIAVPEHQSGEAAYKTRVGETRSVHLGDGSEVDLNTATTLRTQIDSSRRQVVLVRGEALFHVAKNPALPFEVLLGQQRVRVVGTVFDVVRTDRKLTVTVAEGRVLFSTATADHSVLLLSGDQLVYRPDAGTRISHVPAATVSAWRNGYLVYENATLADIADDLNRYFKRKVIVADGPTARQKFSGILRMDREEAVLNRLSHVLRIKTEYAEGEVVLLRSSAAKD